VTFRSKSSDVGGGPLRCVGALLLSAMSCACGDDASSDPYLCPTDGVGTWEWLPVPTVAYPLISTAAVAFGGGHLVVRGDARNQSSLSVCATEEDCTGFGGARLNLETMKWSKVTETGAPSPRGDAGSFSNGDSVVFWGGITSFEGGTFYPEDGGIYAPATDTWEMIPNAATGEGRRSPLIVWTGSKLLVWGGYYYPDPADYPEFRASGLVYDSTTGEWSKMNAEMAPYSFRGVWTGDELLIWSGVDLANEASTESDTEISAAYNPETDSWRLINMDGAPDLDATESGTWTGKEYVVFGGWDPDANRYLGDGAAYDPETDTWRTLTSTGAPHWSIRRRGVWTGKHVVARGNRECPVAAFYDPELDEWTKTTAPSLGWEGMMYMFWTGKALLLYEDLQESQVVPTGVLYATDP
jgi:hypothetical protein